MLNPRLQQLTDSPFQRLRDLIDGVAPGGAGEPVSLALGEPRHPFPDFVAETVFASPEFPECLLLSFPPI